MRNLKEKNGITLIALVITIIILLILAGVSFSAITGENGIISKAKLAKEKSEQASIEEKEDLEKLENEIDIIITGNDNSVTNPYEPNDWECAWTCTNGVWSEKIVAGTTISDNVDIIAKFYKTGNKVTPPEFYYAGKTWVTPEDDEYILVIEGSGMMGPLSDTFFPQVETSYAWQKDVAKIFNGQAVDECLIIYVKEAIITDGIQNIGDSAFLAALSLEKITFGKDIKTIGKCAINTCKSLKTLEIPSTVTEIGKSMCFETSSLESLTLPDNITIIPLQSFNYCRNLKTIDIPDNITTIDESAFEGCIGLTEVTIPNKVLAIGEDAFNDCTNLSKIKVLTIDENLAIGNNAFYNLAQDSVIYVLSEDVKTKLEGKYDLTKTTVEVITETEMNEI